MIKQQKAFTLIEIMIVVVIIGILAAIAVPNYQEYMTRTKRSEGMSLLSDAAAQQERFYAQNNSYVNNNNDIARLGLRNTDAANKKVMSDNSYYTLTISSMAGDGGYTLTATQAIGDTACGNLTLNALGTKGRSGTEAIERCWK